MRICEETGQSDLVVEISWKQEVSNRPSPDGRSLEGVDSLCFVVDRDESYAEDRIGQVDADTIAAENSFHKRFKIPEGHLTSSSTLQQR